MRYIKSTSDGKSESSEITTASQKTFETLTEIPDIILHIAEFLPSSEKWFEYRLVNRRTRKIFQDLFENHARHCILNQCETALLQFPRTLTEKLKRFDTEPFVADVYRINVIVYNDQHIVVSNIVQENSPFCGASHQTVNKELLQTMFRQISGNSLSSNSNRKIPLMRMQLSGYKPNIWQCILATITTITFCAGIIAMIISAPSPTTGVLRIMLALFSVRICAPLIVKAMNDNFRFWIQKNLQNALAANVIKTGRIAVCQNDNSALSHVLFDLYIPKNAFTLFHQPNNDGALVITPDTRVAEIPETPEREPGANGLEVKANETSSLLLYQQLK